MSEQMDQHSLNEGRAFPWHEVYAPDAKAAIAFYVEALGFGTQSMPMGEAGEYLMLTRDGKAVAGAMSTVELGLQDVPAHWAVYTSVDDVDARLEKVKTLGGTVVVEPMDIPTVGRMALIADPQGAHIWLYKASEE